MDYWMGLEKRKVMKRVKKILKSKDLSLVM
jgi:hypothetical protein